MSAYTYTLIIPHYNIPNLLDRLLQTVPHRDDMQVIVIDDCSTEKLDQLEEIRQKYAWIEWLSTDTNGGGGKARNVGLKNAKGKYLIFADADDYFLPEFDNFLERVKKEKFDIWYFTALFYNELERKFFSPENFKVIGRYLKSNNVVKLKYRFWQPWCKIINKDIIIKYNIQFDETDMANDEYFSTLVDYYTNDIKVSCESLYVYYIRQKSKCHNISPDRALSKLKVELRRHLFLNSKNIPNNQNYLNALNVILDCKDYQLIQKANALLRAYQIKPLHIFLFKFTRLLKNFIFWDTFNESLRFKIKSLFGLC